MLARRLMSKCHQLLTLLTATAAHYVTDTSFPLKVDDDGTGYLTFSAVSGKTSKSSYVSAGSTYGFLASTATAFYWSSTSIISDIWHRHTVPPFSATSPVSNTVSTTSGNLLVSQAHKNGWLLYNNGVSGTVRPFNLSGVRGADFNIGE